MFTLTVTLYLAAQVAVWHSQPVTLAACQQLAVAVMTDDTAFPLPQGGRLEVVCEPTKTEEGK